MKKIFLIILFISSSITSLSANVPLLSYPVNNQKYVQTVKLSVKWLKVLGETSYQIQVSKTSEFQPTDIVIDFVRTGEEATLPTLEQSTVYFWRVRVNSDTTSWSSIWKFTTTGPPREIFLLEPINGSNNIPPEIVTFKWSKDSANASFNLQVSGFSDFADTLINIFTDDEEFEITNIGAGRQLYWRVKPYNIDGVPGQWTAPFNFKTKLSKPILVSPYNFTNNHDTSLVFVWNKLNLASIYQFQLSFDKEFDDSLLIESLETTFNQIKIDSLVYNTIYYWRVIGLNAFNDSSNWSEANTFKTKLASPKLFAPVHKSINNDIPVTFNWEAFGETDYFRFQAAVDSNFINKISDRILDDTTYSLTTLKNNQRYYWRVNLRNSVGDTSNWSRKFSFKTKLNKPGIIYPSENDVTLANNSFFNWHPVDSADTYHLQISTDSSFTELVYEETTKDTFAVVNTLESNLIYYYRLQASNKQNETSNWTSRVTFKTFILVLTKYQVDSRTNFSKTFSDIVDTVTVINPSLEAVDVASIFAEPDSLFYTDSTRLTVNPSGQGFFRILADTAMIDTGTYHGEVNLVRIAGSRTDTLKLPINFTSIKAIGSFNKDTLSFDTTSAGFPEYERIRLRNKTGNYPLIISKMEIEGPAKKSFKILTEVESINSGDSTEITIEFIPTLLDTNFARVVITTNSYPHRKLKLNLLGFGKGGVLSGSTTTALSNLENDIFETLTNNDKKITFENSGSAAMELTFAFVDNYFRIKEGLTKPVRLNPGDTSSITLQYVTPNFDSLNVDTLKIFHTGIAVNPVRYVIKGGFDSAKTANKILDNFYISSKKFSGGNLVVDQSTSIQAEIKNNILDDMINLDYRLRYYLGGPGLKHSAAKSGSKFFIPFEDVTAQGLVIKGELFTKAYGNTKIDSVTIFNLVDVQVVLHDYTTQKIVVPKSIPAQTASEAETKWVMFGFPFAEVAADSVFKQFGGRSKMEDGEWIVYEYDSSQPNEFKQLNSYYLETDRAYFIAQSVQDVTAISYKYENLVRARKLTDTILVTSSNGWKTITNPYTFDVEVDTAVVMYRFDSQRRSYRLTNVMKPGEGYFVDPSITEIKLKTFGEYFPLAYPAVLAKIGWHVELNISSESQADQILVTKLGNEKLLHLNKAITNKEYLKPPELTNSFGTYLRSEDRSKLLMAIGEGSDGNVWELVIKNGRVKTGLKIERNITGNIPENLLVVLFDEAENKILTEGYTKSFLAGEEKILKVLLGTDKFITQKIRELQEAIPYSFSLEQNYPNPFNPTTTIKFTVPLLGGARGGSIPVSIILYDILGREVQILINKPHSPGEYEIEFDGHNLASGVYFYSMSVGKNTATRKMILLK